MVLFFGGIKEKAIRYFRLPENVFLKVDDDFLCRNPMGRTGIAARGLLGRWGPNHVAESIVTRYEPMVCSFVRLEVDLPKYNSWK